MLSAPLGFRSGYLPAGSVLYYWTSVIIHSCYCTCTSRGFLPAALHCIYPQAHQAPTISVRLQSSKVGLRNPLWIPPRWITTKPNTWKKCCWVEMCLFCILQNPLYSPFLPLENKASLCHFGCIGHSLPNALLPLPVRPSNWQAHGQEVL